MPLVRNRTAIDGLNLRIGRSIPAHGEIEVSADEAAELDGSPLLEVLPDPPGGSTGGAGGTTGGTTGGAGGAGTPNPDLQEAEDELKAAQEHLAELKGSN